MVTNLSQHDNLISAWMYELRDITRQTDRNRFRRNIERIGQVAAYEISKTLTYSNKDTQTPIAPTNSRVLNNQPVLATILRAGLPLYNGLLSYFDEADSAFIGAYRKHHDDHSFEIAQGYIACPDLSGRTLIVADPMLATAASMLQTLSSLIQYGIPSQLHIVAVVASPDGMAEISRKHPEAHIWVAAIDEGLNADKYIVPGLGDAGDLGFGEKLQR